MQKMQKIKKHLPLVVIIGILFVTGVVFANVFISQNKVGVSTVSADDNEDEPEDENEDEDENGNENEDENKDEDREDDKDESAKDKAEKERESAKKANEAKREQSKQEAEDDGDADNDIDEVDDADDADEDDDAMEEIQDLAKKIVKLEIKLNAAAEGGANVSAMLVSLNSIKDLLAQAQEKAAAGDTAGAEALTEEADKKLDALKKSMELAFGDDDDDEDGIEEDDDESELGDEAKEYKNKVAQFVHDLKELRELGIFDGGIGQQVSAVAQAQNDDIEEVEDSINDIKERGKFAKFLIGPKYDSIAEVKTAIAENQARIEILTGVMNQITDPAVKLVLQDQINQFQQENNKLQAFVAGEEDTASVFGWLIRLFS